MNYKLLILGVILGFSFCYTEWGTDQSAFIFEIEARFFEDLKDNISAFAHPLILAGLLGQIGLVSCIFIPKPKKWLLLGSLILLSVIVFFFLLAGILSGNYRIILSTFPFWILSFLLLKVKSKIN
ncbi:hypothetical protein [Algoriphagus sp. A40]|uniref:hypothetical protein n=1 Tax=Algoriphagus sp. A40 TaxID=1945863 RepID=UPI000986A294|nr:hypothetical protein [Algoriphagus sp. A40]OOG73045.1 hypothetical protein B0E43_14060 [Algoriphagus sp. A40]